MAMGTHGAKVLILCPSNWPKPIKYIWGCIFAILFWGGGGEGIVIFLPPVNWSFFTVSLCYLLFMNFTFLKNQYTMVE